MKEDSLIYSTLLTIVKIIGYTTIFAGIIMTTLILSELFNL